jgi:hypothetical protein
MALGIRHYIWIFLLVSCSAAKHSGDGRNFTYSYCEPNHTIGELVWSDSPGPGLPAGQLSPHDRILYRELGISGYIVEALSLKGDSVNYPRIRLLKQRVADRVRTAGVELESVSAELDCEGERANLAAIYLDNMNSRRNRKLTVASVVVGALTTVAASLIEGRSGQIATGVGGGLLSAGLALSTINPEGQTIGFYHGRNLLHGIWVDSAANKDYPVFVWHILHEKQFSNSGEVTLAQSIRNRWLQFEFDGKPEKKQTDLLFGGGGAYHADELHMRAAMLNQLQSTIRSINQDLVGVVEFIEKM